MHAWKVMAPASDRPCGPTKPGAARPAGPGRRHSSAHAYGARAALPNLVLQLARRRRHANTRASGCCGAVVNGTPRGPRGRPRCSCPIGYARGVTRAQRGSGPSPVLWPSVGLPRHAGISGVPPQVPVGLREALTAPLRGEVRRGSALAGANSGDSGVERRHWQDRLRAAQAFAGRDQASVGQPAQGTNAVAGPCRATGEQQ